jgi:hypothetical protein
MGWSQTLCNEGKPHGQPQIVDPGTIGIIWTTYTKNMGLPPWNDWNCDRPETATFALNPEFMLHGLWSNSGHSLNEQVSITTSLHCISLAHQLDVSYERGVHLGQ